MKKKGMGKTGRRGKGRRVSLWSISLILSFQVLGWLLFSMATPGPVEAKTFIVTSTLDETDTNAGDGVCLGASGYCTLRAAIQQANAFPGPDVIKLKTGLYMLTITGTAEDLGATGDLDITDNLAIIGTGAKNTFINGGKLDRVFHIIGSISVSFNNLTIQNGLATEGGPGGEAVGGGILNDGSTLKIIASTISNNIASGPSGPGLALGGGIYNVGGSLTIKKGPITNIKSTISNNVARGGSYGGGGGILASSTVVTIRGSTLFNNVAQGDSYGEGGGIYNFVSTVTITRSILSNNFASGITAGNGGGIYTDSTVVTITESTLSNNSASGITAGNGGGIYSFDVSTLTVQSASKIVRNFASDGEGGIYSDPSSTVTISPNSTVAKNIPNDKNF
jgi:CSLREA domain-containing protein